MPRFRAVIKSYLKTHGPCLIVVILCSPDAVERVREEEISGLVMCELFQQRFKTLDARSFLLDQHGKTEQLLPRTVVPHTVSLRVHDVLELVMVTRLQAIQH